jgi:hypothetical protein
MVEKWGANPIPLWRQVMTSFGRPHADWDRHVWPATFNEGNWVDVILKIFSFIILQQFYSHYMRKELNQVSISLLMSTKVKRSTQCTNNAIIYV